MANQIEWWVGRLADGSERSSHELGAGFEHDVGIVKLAVKVQGRDEPFNAHCEPQLGQTLALRTRRAHKVGGPEPTTEPIEMPYIEMRMGETTWRLYVHPVHGPILSSLDLNL